MALTTSNIYSGPIVRVEVDGDEMGAMTDASAEITFDGVTAALADGNQYQGFGMGKFSIEMAESDATLITKLATDKAAAVNVDIFTQYTDATHYTRFRVSSVLLNYSTKRGFGDDPHKVIISGQRKALNESNFVARTVAS